LVPVPSTRTIATRIEHDHCAFGVLARERLRRFQHRDRGAEAAKRLRQLEADRTRADDDEVLRPHGEIEHGLIGEMRRGFEPGNRRKRRRGPGGDDEAPGPDLGPLAHQHGLLVLEARNAFDHANAETSEPLLGIVRLDRGDDVVHVLVDPAEVDVERRGRDSESRPVGDGAGVLAGSDQRFRGDAAGVEAIAAQLALLDQHDRHAEGGGGGRDRKAAGTRADDADVGFQAFGHARAPRSQLMSSQSSRPF
jgi:hypothetical protein